MIDVLIGAPLCFGLGFLWGKLHERRRWNSQEHRQRLLYDRPPIVPPDLTKIVQPSDYSRIFPHDES